MVGMAVATMVWSSAARNIATITPKIIERTSGGVSAGVILADWDKLVLLLCRGNARSLNCRLPEIAGTQPPAHQQMLHIRQEPSHSCAYICRARVADT